MVHKFQPLKDLNTEDLTLPNENKDYKPQLYLFLVGLCSSAGRAADL